jgi:hypothetical protein
MATTTTFDSTKESLQNILDDVREGKVQLPEFQRGWVWDDEHIRSLLASISLSYPIGAVMMLQTGNPDVRFKARLLEGVQLDPHPSPQRFVLDGQQRLTSLFQALCLDKSVATYDIRGRSIQRWYYLDMVKSLDPYSDREEAVLGFSDDRKVRNFRGEVIEDYSEKQAEYQHCLFPLTEIFNCADWRRGFNKFWHFDEEKIQLFDEFDEQIIKRFEQYHVPIIKLLKETPKEAVCQVFEKVNTGGVSLTVFELLTATFAVDEYDLREDWEGQRDSRGAKVKSGRVDRLRKQHVLGTLESTDFLQAVTLIATYNHKIKRPEVAISCKRKDILRLTLADYQAWAEPITRGFEKAAKLLHSQKIFTARDLPYRTQLVPLAALYTVLGVRADNDGARAKLLRWYWCGVFGELYGGATETRFAKDLPDVVAWIEGGSEPTTVTDSNFAPTRLFTLRSKNSAAYKGLNTLLLRDGGLDLLTGEAVDLLIYFADQIDIHHIFPREYCRKAGIEVKYYDCIVNKTPLSGKTNRIIGSNAPSIYLERLQNSANISRERMDELIRSHVADPGAMRTDNFDGFFAARQKALLNRIEKATGKIINRDPVILSLQEADEYRETLEEIEEVAVF